MIENIKTKVRITNNKSSPRIHYYSCSYVHPKMRGQYLLAFYSENKELPCVYVFSDDGHPHITIGANNRWCSINLKGIKDNVPESSFICQYTPQERLGRINNALIGGLLTVSTFLLDTK